MTHRVLTIAHGHPDIISGGGEIAAHGLHSEYANRPDVEGAWFLSAAEPDQAATGRLRRHRENEYLWEQNLARVFPMIAANLDEVTGYFADLLRHLKPTVVHSHHFFRLGLEYFKVIKDIDPGIRLVLTLHEYLAICPNAGLMMRQDTRTLCRSGRWDTHVGCTEAATYDALWLRKHRFDKYFSYIDHFVAPSEFLRERYIEWGLSPAKIAVIRNGQPTRKKKPPRPLNADGRRNLFAYFGQINEHKGLQTILEGLQTLSASERAGLQLEVHGANLEFQPRPYREKLSALAAPLMEAGVVVWKGPYTQDELASRMAGIDWVVVPSNWYENAPLVIQEAFSLGRPVIASDLGGMREAVQHGTTSRLVARGDNRAWALEMLRSSNDPDGWARMYENISPPVTLQDSAESHLELFRSLEPAIA